MTDRINKINIVNFPQQRGIMVNLQRTYGDSLTTMEDEIIGWLDRMLAQFGNQIKTLIKESGEVESVNVLMGDVRCQVCFEPPLTVLVDHPKIPTITDIHVKKEEPLSMDDYLNIDEDLKMSPEEIDLLCGEMI